MDTVQSIKPIEDAEVRTYIVKTAVGSRLTMVYKPTMFIEYEGNSCEQGDMLLQGFSKVAGAHINLGGIGFKPEVGSYITVRPFPDEDYDPTQYSELITNLQEVPPTCLTQDSLPH